MAGFASRLRRIPAAAGAAARRPAVLVLGGLLVAWLALYFAYTPPNLPGSFVRGKYQAIMARGDGHYMYINMLSMVFDRDIDIDNQCPVYGDPFGSCTGWTVTHRRPIYPIGTSILQIPTFLVAHASAAVGNLFGAGIGMHGYTLWHQRITFLGALLAGFFTLLLSYRLARRHVSETAALYGVVLAGFGTTLFFYSVYWVSYPHAWSALAVALLVEYWDRTRGRHDARRWALLGAYVGLAALTRLQEITFAVLPAAEAVAELARRLRRRDLSGAGRLAGYGALAAACALAVVSPQLIATKIVYGGYFVVPAGKHYMRWDAPFLWEVLFSSRNGMFVWTPLAYLATLSLTLAPRGKARRVAAGFLAAFFLQLWVNGSSFDWWGNWGFSARRMCNTTIILAAGFAFLVDRLRALHARYPRVAPHLAFLLPIFPFLFMNVSISCNLATGRRKPAVSATDMAKAYADLTGSAIRAVHHTLGNPFAWPANWFWALRHRVPPGRYDQIVGSERLGGIEFYRYRTRGARTQELLKMSDDLLRLYGAGPWGKARKTPPTWAWAHPGARLLLPLFVWEDEHWILRAAQPPPAAAARPVTLDVNGAWRTVITPTADPQDYRLDIPDRALHAGTNELTIRCDPPPIPDAGCLAVESLQLVYESRR